MFGTQIFERSTENCLHFYLNSTQNTRIAIQNCLQDICKSAGRDFVRLKGFRSTQHERNFQHKQLIKLYHILSKRIHFTNWPNFSNGAESFFFLVWTVTE